MHLWTAKKIRELREAYKESRRQFAQRMAVSVHTIRCWELAAGEPNGPARLLLSRLEEDFKAGKIRELEPASV